MHSQQLNWLRLAAVKGFSPRRLKLLYEALGSAERLFCTSLAALTEAGASAKLAPLLRQARSLAEERFAAIDRWLQADPQHHLLTLEDNAYPPRLRQIDDPPPLLYVHGDPELLACPQIALVGGRKATLQGEREARGFAEALSRAGLIPTSGLALGIDACAHEGALHGMGLTIAVLGSGVDQIHPRRNSNLARSIVASGGALVSEFPLTTAPLPAYFPRRNRIISGLSLGVLVVEATLRSGSLITARLATEQGREVFAVPGSIRNPASEGCHQLIRQGAVLTTCCDDILSELGPQIATFTVAMPMAEESAPTAEARLPPFGEAGLVLKACGFEPTPLDLLVERSGLSAAQTQAELLALELDGHVTAVTGGYQRC